MKRRNFLTLAGLGAFETIYIQDQSLQSGYYLNEYFPELAKHKIIKTKILEVNYKWQRFVKQLV
jgi:hypothetical protein